MIGWSWFESRRPNSRMSFSQSWSTAAFAFSDRHPLPKDPRRTVRMALLG